MNECYVSIFVCDDWKHQKKSSFFNGISDQTKPNQISMVYQAETQRLYIITCCGVEIFNNFHHNHHFVGFLISGINYSVFLNKQTNPGYIINFP